MDTTTLVVARAPDWKYDRLPGLAAELVRLKVDVIVAASPPATKAAKQATSTIPIVFTVSGDPVAEGFVASLARPGGNITSPCGTLVLSEAPGKLFTASRDLMVAEVATLNPDARRNLIESVVTILRGSSGC